MILCPPFFRVRQNLDSTGLESNPRPWEVQAGPAQVENGPQQVGSGLQQGGGQPVRRGVPRTGRQGSGPPLYIDEYRFAPSLLIEAYARILGPPSRFANYQKVPILTIVVDAPRTTLRHM